MATSSKFNAAQRLRQALGIESVEIGSFPRNASATKRGPGRRHVDGVEKNAPIKPPKAGFGFVQHIANAVRRSRRNAIAQIGIRQFKRQQRRERATVADIVS